jgi:micrococcal nuclease
MAVWIIAVSFYVGLRFLSVTPKSGAAAKAIIGETAFVERVVDGDTLKLSDKRRVRLIGVDTPELHYSEKLLRDSQRTHKDIKAIQELGAKAADFTRSLCERKSVRIETDVRKLDKYGRLLAYIYLEDGTFLNAKILEEGYGQVMTIPPDVKYADYFLKLGRKAKESARGLWAITDNM